jgi:hypothetical protein
MTVVKEGAEAMQPAQSSCGLEGADQSPCE